MTTHSAWDVLEKHCKTQKNQALTEYFKADTARVSKLTIDVGALSFDFSKTHINEDTIGLFSNLFDERNFAQARDGLFAGDILNPSEKRPVLHTALRGSFAPETARDGSVVSSFIDEELKKLRRFVSRVHKEGRFSHVLHLGIGGSALGPEMVVEALTHLGPKMDVHVVSNVDGAALAAVLPKLDASRTIVVIASKTFTTLETLMNADTVIGWLKSEAIQNPMEHLVAATANPVGACEYGIDESSVFAFAEWVGGRYSLWSTIGLPIALGLGVDVFDALLDGAADMDRHFKESAFAENAPMLAAAIDVFYGCFCGAQSRAVFAYDSRLNLLVPYLQQLEMESNGKAVDMQGKPVSYPTGAIVWGGVGTDAQHAVFQLLHQGTHLIPSEFIAVIKPDHHFARHHQQLLANCFGQTTALMQGQKSDEPAKAFEGNRPSMVTLLDQLTPRTLGALLAFYEHRTFAVGRLLNINSFDQMGVELGKQLAKSLTAILEGRETDEHLDPSTKKLLGKIQ